MSCKRATMLISAASDRPLTRRERFALRWHLLVCSHCRRFQRHARMIADAARSMTEAPGSAAEVAGTMPRDAPSLDPEVRERIADRLRGS